MKATQLNNLDLNSNEAKQIAGLLSGLQAVRSITNFVRISNTELATRNTIRTGTGSAQLGTSSGPSRFSPVYADKTNHPKFNILYCSSTLGTATYEAIIRDRFDLDATRILLPPDYRKKCAVNISTQPGQTLTLLDLTSGNAVRFGVPTEVINHSNHEDGQHFSEFVHRQMPHVDGFLYSSRFTSFPCVGIYSRAVTKLTSGIKPLVLTRSLLGDVLSRWNIAVM